MYLVIGATGNVGKVLVRELLEQGSTVRVFTRDLGKAARWNGNVEVVTGDLTRGDTAAKALDGVQGAFLMGTGRDTGHLAPLIAAAKGRSVDHLVFLSSGLAANPELLLGKFHTDVENLIRASGIAWTFLRPTAFMTNTYQWSESIRRGAIVYNPFGDLKILPIAPDDIAAVAAAALQRPEYRNTILTLTGGEHLRTREQVQILSGVLAKEIECVDVTVESAVQGMINRGIPATVAAAVGEAWQFSKSRGASGSAFPLTDTVQKVTGRAPKCFAVWALENAARFC